LGHDIGIDGVAAALRICGVGAGASLGGKRLRGWARCLLLCATTRWDRDLVARLPRAEPWALAAGGVASRRGIWWPGVAAPGRGLCSWWQGRLTEPVVTGPTDPDRFASSQPVQIQNLNLNSKNEKNSQYSQKYFKVCRI
jgi:hypothetical protein